MDSPRKGASNAKFGCFCCGWPEQIVEQTFKLPVILNAMKLQWSHLNAHWTPGLWLWLKYIYTPGPCFIINDHLILLWIYLSLTQVGLIMHTILMLINSINWLAPVGCSYNLKSIISNSYQAYIFGAILIKLPSGEFHKTSQMFVTNPSMVNHTHNVNSHKFYGYILFCLVLADYTNIFWKYAYILLGQVRLYTASHD